MMQGFLLAGGSMMEVVDRPASLMIAMNWWLESNRVEAMLILDIEEHWEKDIVEANSMEVVDLTQTFLNKRLTGK